MKREIKFRIFHKPSGKIYNVHTLHWDGKGDVIGGYFHDELHNEFAFSIEEVDLMQYTGLKDKNGKEIYESDILKYHGIVAWNDVEHRWSVIDLNWNDKREWHNIDYLTSPFEIIGNKNPELL